jgi:hypothetical protein
VLQAIQDELVEDVQALLQEAQAIGTAHAQVMLKKLNRAFVIGSYRNLFKQAKNIVSGIIDHVSESIQKALGKEQDEDGEQSSPSDVVDETINDLIDELPELVAETEITGAIESAVLGTLKDGGVQRVRWIAEPDACAMCRELAEQGAIDADGGEFLGGISSPPLHPRCKCNLAPVDEGE